jgi:hypothetical protein
MKRKLLLACAVILVIAMITLPVMAAPAQANPLDQILSFVKDYKTKLETILTKLTLLQTDVTTIKRTTTTINTKLNAPPEPIRYEYLTADMGPRDQTSSTMTYALFMNTGDIPAEVCYEQYVQPGSLPLEVYANCITIDAKKYRVSRFVVGGPTYGYFYKINTTSKYIAPYAYLRKESDGTTIMEYLPGDFQKVEIYS